MLSRRSTFSRRGPVSERVFGKAYAEAEHGGAWLAAGLFAIALFLFVASLSVLPNSTGAPGASRSTAAASQSRNARPSAPSSGHAQAPLAGAPTPVGAARRPRAP